MTSGDSDKLSSQTEYRAVITYLYLKGKTGMDIHLELVNVYGDSGPSYTLVKFWVAEFKRVEWTRIMS